MSGPTSRRSLSGVAVAVAAATLVVAAASNPVGAGHTGKPPGSGATDGAVEYDSREFDEILLDVVAAFPDFGGFYLTDEGDTLQVWLRSGGASEARRARSELHGRFPDQVAATSPVQIQIARYTWDQLHSWSRALQLHLDHPGVVFTDVVDFRTSR